DRRRVVLNEDRVLRGAVARVRHRLRDVVDRGRDFAFHFRDVARGEVARHRRVVVAVVGPPRRREQEVFDAVLHDAREVEVVAADRDGHELHVVGSGEVLEHQRLAFFAARVVEVQTGLPRFAFAEAVRLGTRAREVLAAYAAADVDLGRLRAVAVGDQFRVAGRVVVVRGGAERVDPGRAFVRAARPAAG